LIDTCEISPRHNVTQAASEEMIYAHSLSNHEKERKCNLSWDSRKWERNY